jgi:hypothetical protein
LANGDGFSSAEICRELRLFRGTGMIENDGLSGHVRIHEFSQAICNRLSIVRRNRHSLIQP